MTSSIVKAPTQWETKAIQTTKPNEEAPYYSSNGTEHRTNSESTKGKVKMRLTSSIILTPAHMKTKIRRAMERNRGPRE